MSQGFGQWIRSTLDSFFKGSKAKSSYTAVDYDIKSRDLERLANARKRKADDDQAELDKVKAFNNPQEHGATDRATMRPAELAYKEKLKDIIFPSHLIRMKQQYSVALQKTLEQITEIQVTLRGKILKVHSVDTWKAITIPEEIEGLREDFVKAKKGMAKLLSRAVLTYITHQQAWNDWYQKTEKETQAEYDKKKQFLPRVMDENLARTYDDDLVIENDGVSQTAKIEVTKENLIGTMTIAGLVEATLTFFGLKDSQGASVFFYVIIAALAYSFFAFLFGFISVHSIKDLKDYLNKKNKDESKVKEQDEVRAWSEPKTYFWTALSCYSVLIVLRYLANAGLVASGMATDEQMPQFFFAPFMYLAGEESQSWGSYASLFLVFFMMPYLALQWRELWLKEIKIKYHFNVLPVFRRIYLNYREADLFQLYLQNKAQIILTRFIEKRLEPFAMKKLMREQSKEVLENYPDIEAAHINNIFENFSKTMLRIEETEYKLYKLGFLKNFGTADWMFDKSHSEKNMDTSEQKRIELTTDKTPFEMMMEVMIKKDIQKLPAQTNNDYVAMETIYPKTEKGITTASQAKNKVIDDCAKVLAKWADPEHETDKRDEATKSNLGELLLKTYLEEIKAFVVMGYEQLTNFNPDSSEVLEPFRNTAHAIDEWNKYVSSTIIDFEIDNKDCAFPGERNEQIRILQTYSTPIPETPQKENAMIRALSAVQKAKRELEEIKQSENMLSINLRNALRSEERS